MFVDTSAFLAILDADDQNHVAAAETWADLVSRDEVLVCSNYILVETFALVQHRLGIEAVRSFQEDIVPLLQIEWLNAAAHARSVSALLTAGRRQLSLVDCASFDVMRSREITTAFVFDRHFAEQGFHCRPAAKRT
jgi:predicted nucleic acid-binding protein